MSITSHVDRRKESLRVVVDIPLGELLAHLGPRADQFASRLKAYFARMTADVMQIGALIASEEGAEVGQVKWFDESRGYGFIRGHDSQDVFVHWHGIAGDGYKILKKGQLVRFKRRMGKETFEAIEVVPIDEQPK